MNSLLYYYNNVQKMAAYRQAKRMQCGVKLGENQIVTGSTTSKFVSNPISIGTDDFSVEFYGNVYGQNSSYASVFNAVSPLIGGSKTFSIYGQYYPDNGVWSVAFSPDTSGNITGDEVRINYSPGNDSKFLVSVTRQGTTVKAYINGELKATKEQSEVKDLGDLQLAIANSSDVGFVRVWNYALSADDVTAHYNNGDPMGYVVPKAEKDMIPIEITSANTYTWDEEHTAVYHQLNFTPAPLPGIRKYRVNVTVSNYEAGAPYFYTGKFYYIPPRNGTYDILVDIGTDRYEKMFPMYGGQSITTRKLTLTVNSVTPVGLIAEYLPQNLMEPRKYKFPLGSFTQSANTFSCSASTTNKVYDNPQANGFSGEFMRFEAITDITLTCSFYIDVVQRAYPIRVTAEYRSNADLIGAYSSGPVVMSKNEKEASIVSFDIPNGISNSEYIRCADNPEAWLEMRILSIEPIPNMATSWLDSAKQLPLSDEYMEPLFQSIGGYDMTANGAPEILYYGPKPNSKGVTLSLSPLKAVGIIYTPPISGDMSIQLFAYDDKAISDQTITLMGGVISNTDVECHLMVYGYEDGYVLSILASGHRLGDVIIGQQGVFSEDIILAVDNSNIRVYANGDFKGNIDTSGYNITLDTIVLTGDAKVTSLFRVFNKALTAEEVATLHNNGNPDAYVLPASMKQGDQRCVLEWLPENIVPDSNNPSTASEWLDTATVLPEDNVQPKITQSVGGYDGMFQGNPTIVY